MKQLNVKKEGILLAKTTLGFEAEGVLNPAIIKDQNGIHLFYRAVAKGNYSTIGYCRLSDPLTVEERFELPVLYPQFEYESQGIEDPRIVKIDAIYYLTYTAYDGLNARGALATSTDLVTWQKEGLIVSDVTFEEFKHFSASKGAVNEKYVRFNQHQISHGKEDKGTYLWDKNVIFFPRKIDGKYCFLHRIKPDIQIVTGVENLQNLTPEFWQNYFLDFNEHIVLSSLYNHEISYIGGGCPPIETPNGWLLIYHGVHDTANGYVYCACAALLDIESPHKEIARLPYPLFSPEEDWELKGEVNNVCFPTGTILEGDKLFIYYGAADERIGVASLSISELLKELLLFSQT